MLETKPKADILIEASWEVCNKVGGIYTVVKSKADIINRSYDDYLLVGPNNPKSAMVEARQAVPPEWLKNIFDKLADEGINCFYGKWRTKGEPTVILIDFYKWANRINDTKKWLWESFGVETHTAGWDYHEPMIWAMAVGRLVEMISQAKPESRVVGHFHEWLAGVALLYLKERKCRVGTVFTTHATMLGRAIAGSGGDLYNMLGHIDPHEEAKRLGVLDKFTTEKACAQNADVFTTVSEITSIEAENLLGKRADVLLLNGLDSDKFPTFEESSILHTRLRDHVRQFLSSYFFPYYRFDLEQSLLFFIVGRYEFKNKGIDIFIKSLGRLNDRMKLEGSRKTVIAFVWVPAGVSGIKPEVLENHEQLEQIRTYIENSMPAIKGRLIRAVIEDEQLEKVKVFNEEEILDLNTFKVKFNTKGVPPLSTHQLYDEENDAVLNEFRACGLLNREEDKVKVIFYPVYLDGSDRLLELKYYKALQACHLGVFPSYYEPWGYTPLESAALGVPAITTDLAGFGRFMNHKRGNEEQKGIFVISRLNTPDEDAIQELSDIMHSYTMLNSKGRVEQKMVAKKQSELADWKTLANNYIEAHNIAAPK